ARRLQSSPVQHAKLAPVRGDQSFVPKRPKDAIDMHSGQTESIGQLLLRQRQLGIFRAAEVEGAKSHQDLANHMGRPGVGGARAYPSQALAGDRRVDQKLAPHGVGDAGPLISRRRGAWGTKAILARLSVAML